MHSSGTHIVTRCEWNTAFDSKDLATALQTYISKWSTYKMQRIINSVFDRFCPEGQTMKIKKLSIDLGAITYENMERELPIRLKNALYDALYALIMYPKSGDQTLEVVNASMAQLSILKAFLLEGMLPWNYQESYGSANEIMRLQLTNNRLEIIQLIQEIGQNENVRKRIAWQFDDKIIKKIITGLEPNNHQQIISFSEEFIKIQEKENVLKTSTQAFKKNLWLWILNYLFVDRGTIFNKIAFVRSTITQIANHFNISYDILVELIEAAIHKNKKYSIVNADFIAILKLLSNELHHKAYTEVKTKKQQENFWKKVVTYFNIASARSNSAQKNEFNELVINLSKLDAKRFQRIIISVEQKPTHWEAILKDLIPAAIENLFIALSPSQSKNVLTQIEFLTQLHTEVSTTIAPIKLYSLGIEFCIKHQNASVSKHDFLTFVIEKIAKKQQESTFSILNRLVGTASTSATTQKTVFIPLFNELKSLYQQEVASANIATPEKLDTIIENYIKAITVSQLSNNETHTLEQKIIQWISIAPKDFWNTIVKTPKTSGVTIHVSTLIATYGTQRFLKEVHPTIASFLQQLQRILSDVSSKNPKHTAAIRAITHVLHEISLAVLLKENIQRIDRFFVKLLIYVQQEKTVHSKTDLQEAIQLLLKHPTMKTIGFSTRELFTIQQQYNTLSKKTTLTTILEAMQEPNQHEKVAELVHEIVRAKKIQQSEYQAHTSKIINYLLADAVNVRKVLFARFLVKIAKANSSYNKVEIEKILDDCFWQTLVLYVSHQGNTQKFRQLFEETIVNTFPEIAFEKDTFHSVKEAQKEAAKTKIAKSAEVRKKENQHESLTSESTLEIILAAIQRDEKATIIAALFYKAIETKKVKTLNFQKHTAEIISYLLVNGIKLRETLIAELLYEAVQTEKIQTSDYQKYTPEIISYLLANGIKLRETLLTEFFTKISKEKLTVSTTEIRRILETNFWKTLVSYTVHNGNEQQFRTLFERNVAKVFSNLKTVKTESISSTVSNNIALTIPVKVTATILFETIQQALQNENTTITIGKKTYTFSELFILGLETSPASIRHNIQHTVHTKKQRVQLQNAITFEAFIVLIPKGLSNLAIELYKSFHMLFIIAKHFGNSQIMATLETLFWEETIASIQSTAPTQKQLKTLLKVTFDELSNIDTLDLLTIVKYIQRNRLAIPKVLKTTLISHHTIFEAIAATKVTSSLSNAIEICIERKKIDALSTHLITQFTIPAWFQHTESYTYENLLHTLITTQPLVVLTTIRSSNVSEIQLTKLSQTIQFSTLINTLVKLYPEQRKRLLDIQKLYESMAMISTTGIATKEIQDVLSKKVWKAWQTGNWSLLTQTNIWNELVWETCGKKNMKTHDFVKAIQSIKTSLPSALQVTFTSLFPDKKKALQITTSTETKTLKQTSMHTQNTSLPDEGISIPNAGLVLLNNYFLMLMERLGVIENNEFKTQEAQENAVHYFQYIVTGLTETEEALLVLNKILAGLSPNTPVKSAVEMTNDQKELIDGLIQAAISYWPEIGQTSIDGFRGNWLVREGILRETEERWELTVEKRAYDVLMLKSPFSFSIIKLPWMPKPLHVTWPF